MLFYWILFSLSGLALALIFWRRYSQTVKSLVFEEELRRKEAEGETQDNVDPLKEVPTELQMKREAERRAREEKTRMIRESKKVYKQAEVHFAKGDYGLAEKHLLQVLSYDNDHLNANLNLGLLYLHQENLPRAEFFFQKLTDLKESPVYTSNLALTLYQQGRLEEAVKLYKRAIEMDNKKPERFVSLAHVYHELGEMEQALINFEIASRLAPREVDYLWTLLDYYEKFSRHRDMVRVLTRILELSPYDEQAKERLKLLEEMLRSSASNNEITDVSGVEN